MLPQHRWIHWLLFFLTVSLGLGFAISQDTCNDVWAHALHGKIMWETGRMPHFSDYSFVPSAEIPIRDNPILEWTLYGLYSFFGYSGFLLYKVILIFGACIFIGLWLRDEGVGWAANAAALCGTLITAHDRFFPRGDLANFTFAALFVWLLRRYELRGGKEIRALPILLFIWIQFHAFASLGILWVTIFWITERWRGTRPPSLGKILFSCLIAAAISEYFDPKLLKPLQWFSPGTLENLFPPTVESAPVFSPLPDILDRSTILKFSIPLCAALIVFPWRRPAPYLSLLVLLVTTAAATLEFRRFMALHALTTVPIVALFLNGKNAHPSGTKPLRELWMSVGFAIVLLIFNYLLWSGLYYRWQPAPQLCRPWPSPILKPLGGIRFIQDHHIPGNVYASYNQGGYVGFQLYPFNKIYIHSLSFWYSGDHRIENDRFANGKIDIQTFAKKHDIAIFLLKHTEFRDSAIYERLLPLKEWPMVYLDETTAICVRNDVASKCNIEAVNLQQFTANKTTVQSIFGHFWLGNFLMRHQAWDQARGFYEKAIQDGVLLQHVYNNLGVIASQQGHPHEAVACFMMSQSFEKNREASANLKKILLQFPNSQDPLFQTAKKTF